MASSSPYSRALNVLLIEDNPGDVFLVRQALKESGLPHHISIAKDGADALDLLYQTDGCTKKPCPDLVLLDLNLPRVSGHEVLRRIKSDEQLKQVPVVIFSSSASKEDVKDAYDNYANCYVCKPSRPEEFFRVIKSIEGFWFSVAQLPTVADRP
jgi:CheY-like chemotaxis protein